MNQLEKPEQKLKRLIIENPDLELMPFCSEECGNPDWGHTMCKFNYCRVDEWTINPYDEERILFKSDDYDDFSAEVDDHDTDCTDEQVKKAWQELPWTKAIIVYVDAY